MQNKHDILNAMRLGVEYRHPIHLRDFQVMVRPLTISETLQVANTVTELISKMPLEARNRLQENVFIAKETLKIAARIDQDKEPPVNDYVLDQLTPDEINYLFKQYVSVTDKVNPCLEQLDKSEIDELVVEVKKNPLRLTEFSFLQLVNMVRYLIERELQTVK